MHVETHTATRAPQLPGSRKAWGHSEERKMELRRERAITLGTNPGTKPEPPALSASDAAYGPAEACCECNATVYPHARERGPFRCSPCRERRVERIIGQRKLAAD